MNIIYYLLTATAGIVVGFVISNSRKPKGVSAVEYEIVLEENKKLKRRNKEIEGEVDKLLSTINSLKNRSREDSLDLNELELEVRNLKEENRKLDSKNEELFMSLKNCREAISEYEDEVKKLKKQL